LIEKVYEKSISKYINELLEILPIQLQFKIESSSESWIPSPSQKGNMNLVS